MEIERFVDFSCLFKKKFNFFKLKGIFSLLLIICMVIVIGMIIIFLLFLYKIEKEMNIIIVNMSNIFCDFI